MSDHAHLSPLQSELADRSKQHAEEMHTEGFAAKAVREVLDSVGSTIPRSDSKDIKDVPKMTQLPEGSKTLPGDLVIIGAQDHISKHGDSFFVTKDGKAASDHVKAMPDLSKLHDVHIYRANEKDS